MLITYGKEPARLLVPRLTTGLKVNGQSLLEFGNAHVVVGPSVSDAIEAFKAFQQIMNAPGPRPGQGSKSNYITCDLLLYGGLRT